MNKKITAIVLSAMLILSMFTYITASAEVILPENIATDYVAEAITGNLFTDATTSGNTQCDTFKDSTLVHENTKLAGESAVIAKGDVSSTNWATGGGGKMTSNREVLDPWAVYKDTDGDGTFTLDNTQMNYKRALAGIALQLNSGAVAASGDRPYMTPEYTRNVVVKVPITMTAGSGNAKVNIARSKYQSDAMGGPNYYAYTGNQASDHEYPVEYNGRDQGIIVSQTGKTYLAATFLGNTTATSDPKYSYTLGMVQGTDAGITLRMEEDEFYIGYEMLHDISVEADNTSVIGGSGATVELSAKVLNQVGSKGTLLQNFTWYALNSDRTSVVNGLNIVEGDEGTATLTIDSTVPAGNYDIVAISDDYSQLVKGVTITVVSLQNDYVAGDITGNTFDVENEASMLSANDTNFVTVDGTNSEYWSFTNSRAIGDGVEAASAYQAFGVIVNKNSWDWQNLHVNGQKFIIGAQVKAVQGTPKFTAGFFEQNRIGDRPDGFAITDGIEITSTTEYMPVCLNMTMTQARNTSENMQYSQLTIGMPEDPAGTTDVGTRKFYMKKGSLFIGYEAAHDIKLSANKTKWTPGKSKEINLDCDIINQVGVPGSLNQDVSWYAMDAERTYVVEGIEITDSGNQDGKAKVVIDDYSVPAGKYSIVAVSKEYGEFIKGIDIEVEYVSVLSELNLEKSGNTFTASAKLLSRNSTAGTVRAMIVIVALDENGKVKDYKVQKITNTYSEYGTASEESTTLTVADGVHHVNAFLWETTDTENPGITDTTLKEFAPMQTLLK